MKIKKKKYKKSRKRLKRNKIIIYSLYLILATLSFYFFFKSYQYISNIPEANNMTQEEIYDLTRIGESDIKLVRALKNEAFDSWLYEANDDKAKRLPKIKETISSIVEGELDISDVDQVISDLQEKTDTITDSDIEELYVFYYKAMLPKKYEKASTAFIEMSVKNPESHYKDIFTLLDLLNKIYNQKGMQSVINNFSFKQSVNLLDEINTSFNEVNEIKSSVVKHSSLTIPIAEPKTRLGMDLDRYVFKVNDYIDSKLMVDEFEQRYKMLQSNLLTNEQLIKKSVDLPDLVGLTVEEAQEKVGKAKLNLMVQGYTNRFYKNGESVPENQRETEPWDDNKEDRIIRQLPSHSEYEFIIEGSTIEIIVENQPIREPQISSDSSSSSSTSSSTTSSSSTEDTSNTTTSNSEDID